MSSHASYPAHSRLQQQRHQMYEREAKDLVKFYQKYKDRQAGIQTPPPSVEQMRSHIDFQPIAFATKQRDAEREHERELAASCEFLVNQQVILPIDPETKAKLYKGISHEQEGRYRYIKERSLLYPEDKYTPPLLSSYDYGWKTVYDKKLYGRPQFAKVAQKEFRDGAVSPRKPNMNINVNGD